MKTSELREIAGDPVVPGTWAEIAAEVIRLREGLAALLKHEGEVVVNGIGCESDSEALEIAKRNADDLLAEHDE